MTPVQGAFLTAFFFGASTTLVPTACGVLNEWLVRAGGGAALLPQSPFDARRSPCPLGLPP